MIKLTKKEKKEIKQNLDIEIYAGLPGSGKTTIAAAEASKCMKKGITVYSNVPITGTHQYNCKDLGLYHMQPNSLIIIDEAGLEFSNRKYATFADYTLRLFKLHRHYKLRILVLSQANDSDKVIRNLAKSVYIVHKRFLGFVASCTYVHTDISPLATQEDIAKIYFLPHPLIQFFERKRYWMPKYWKYFDSWEAPRLPDSPLDLIY